MVVKTEGKILIAYYSRAGQNYVKGTIENLEKGNTQVIAEMIQEHLGGDLLQIESIDQYPADYNEVTKVALDQLRLRARPELISLPEDINKYDVIFLGYPNWWGTMPMPVFTFLETYHFCCKKIFPFCTHEGSGLSNSVRDIKKTCPKANVEEGYAIYGHECSGAENKVARWLDSLVL